MSEPHNTLFTCFPKLPIELRRMVWRHTLPGPRVVHVMLRKLKGGKCSRVWSDCINDEEGNEQFFDMELNGEVFHVRGWESLDIVSTGDKADTDHVLSQQREESHSPAAQTESDTEQHSILGTDEGDVQELEVIPSRNLVENPSSHESSFGCGPDELWGARSSEVKPIVTLFICKESYQVAIDERYTQAFGSFGCLGTIWFSYKHDTLYMEPAHFENGCTPEDLGYDGALVRKLALGHSRDDGFSWMGNRPWDAEMLSWFRNITDFAFVASADNDRVVLDDFALMDIAAALDSEDPRMKMYQLPFCPQTARENIPIIDQVLQKHLALLQNEICDLEAKRQELGETMRKSMERGDWEYPRMNTDFIMPKCSRLAVVTIEQKLSFEQAKEKYEKEKAAYKLNLSISYPGIDPMSYIASVETTLADIWERFADLNEISKDTKIMMSCPNTEIGGFDRLLPDTVHILFTLPGAVDGCVITVDCL